MQGKRGELLEAAAEKSKFRMNGLVMSIYDNRSAAKDTLELFDKNGWIEVVAHGVFKITESGREKLQENNDKDASLDSY